MYNAFDNIESPQRQSFALGLSVVLHAMVLFLMLFNFSWADNDFEKSPDAEPDTDAVVPPLSGSPEVLYLKPRLLIEGLPTELTRPFNCTSHMFIIPYGLERLLCESVETEGLVPVVKFSSELYIV